MPTSLATGPTRATIGSTWSWRPASRLGRTSRVLLWALRRMRSPLWAPRLSRSSRRSRTHSGTRRCEDRSIADRPLRRVHAEFEEGCCLLWLVMRLVRRWVVAPLAGNAVRRAVWHPGPCRVLRRTSRCLCMLIVLARSQWELCHGAVRPNLGRLTGTPADGSANGGSLPRSSRATASWAFRRFGAARVTSQRCRRPTDGSAPSWPTLPSLADRAAAVASSALRMDWVTCSLG